MRCLRWYVAISAVVGGAVMGAAPELVWRISGGFPLSPELLAITTAAGALLAAMAVQESGLLTQRDG
jgi:hypothetical protein